MIDIKSSLKLIDHTLLKPDAKEKDIETLCAEAVKYGFCSAMVQPHYTLLASNYLKGTGVIAATVVGFPFGSVDTEIKEHEAETAENYGAEEVDMVMNIAAFKNREYDYVARDIEIVKRKIKIPLKVIIESCLLTEDEMKKAVKICIGSGADFVKTSTGCSFSGATEDAVRLLKKEAGNRIKVKASGGIRCTDDFLRMVAAGADRIGTSNGVKIAEGLKIDGEY